MEVIMFLARWCHYLQVCGEVCLHHCHHRPKQLLEHSLAACIQVLGLLSPLHPIPSPTPPHTPTSTSTQSHTPLLCRRHAKPGSTCSCVVRSASTTATTGPNSSLNTLSSSQKSRQNRNSLLAVSTSSLCTLRNMTWMHWRRRQETGARA